MTKEVLFVRERRDFQARLAEAEALPDAALTKMTAHRDRLTDEVDQFFSMRRTPPVEMMKARRDLTDAQTEVGFLTGQTKTCK